MVPASFVRAMFRKPTRLCVCLLSALVACGPATDLAGPAEHTGGKADGVSDSQAWFEPRVVTATLAVHAERGDHQLAADARIVVLRSFWAEGRMQYLYADADTFEAGLVDTVALLAASRAANDGEHDDSPYLSQLARTRATALERLVDNESSARPQVRFAVTADMCQSSRPWERGLFDWLLQHGAELGKPAPVGIALTGIWARRWGAELEQLIRWRRDGLLELTWINHSYHHQLSKVGNSYLFLTDPSIDFVSEVLDLERLLLERGELPSLLFRFPGLTHDEHRLAQLNDLGLFALDADAWLAKGQPAQDDSVVLLHGNGNEHQGIELFFDLVRGLGEELATGEAALADPHDVLAR